MFATLAARPCLAQQSLPAEPSSAPLPTHDEADTLPAKRSWYGWQTLGLDAAASALFLAASADDHNTALYGMSGVTFALGGPIVHLAHAQWEMSLGSFGLRALTPILGAALGNHYDRCEATVADHSGGECSAKWTITGIAIGGLAASLVDGLILAYQPPGHATKRLGAPSSLQRSPWPIVAPLAHGAWLGWSTNL